MNWNSYTVNNINNQMKRDLFYIFWEEMGMEADPEFTYRMIPICIPEKVGT